MEVFLVETLDKLKSNNYADLNFVLGNESCDLDSAVSALVYAAFLHWQHMQIKCKVCTRVHRDETLYKDDIFVPILNVAREDYQLKTEVAFCLKEHGIDETKLVFRDDHDLKVLVSTRKSNIILVDHHILPRKDQFLVPFVTEIIDHRPKDNENWNYKDDTRSTMELVGSCCTLVAQRIRTLGALVAKDEDFFDAHPVCTDLLHSAIILDIVNFSKELNKATPQDEEIVLFLESLLKPSNFSEDRKCKLDRLVCARADVASLSAAQLLRKDVKIVADVLVPSFPVLVEEFLRKPGALQAVNEALRHHECTLALLLGMCLDGGLRRDTAVYSPEQPDKAVKLAKYLQQWTIPSLQLTPLELVIDKAGYVYMKQNNLSASRKQYIPVVNEFIQGPK